MNEKEFSTSGRGLRMALKRLSYENAQRIQEECEPFVNFLRIELAGILNELHDKGDDVAHENGRCERTEEVRSTVDRVCRAHEGGE
eukprot:scaffold6936_cov200-Pinguiococcus_pyrenoidosus.AAC.1